MLIRRVILVLLLAQVVLGKLSKPHTYTIDKLTGHLGQPSEDDLKELWELLEPLLIERQPGTEGHRTAQAHIESHFKGLGWEQQDGEAVVMSTPFGPKEFRNLVFTQNPAAKRHLILAAHYDSKVLPGATFIGATDSAAGCAALMFLARRMTCAGDEPCGRQDISLKMVFFDGEEAFQSWSDDDSLYGARSLAEAWSTRPSLQQPQNKSMTALDDIDLLVLLDLLGAADPVIFGLQPSGRLAFDRLARIESRLRGAGLLHTRPAKPFLTAAQPSWLSRAADAIQDDHVPFVTRGVAVVHLIPVTFPPAWHTEKDDQTAVDVHILADWERIVRVFAMEYLHTLQ